MGNKPTFINEDYSKYINNYFSSDLNASNDNEDFVQNLKKSISDKIQFHMIKMKYIQKVLRKRSMLKYTKKRE